MGVGDGGDVWGGAGGGGGGVVGGWGGGGGGGGGVGGGGIFSVPKRKEGFRFVYLNFVVFILKLPICD